MLATLLRRLRRGVLTVAVVANMIGTAVLFVLIAVMNTDVVARGVFHAPFRGVVEVVIFSLVLIVFLQLPDVVRSNRLTRSDGFLGVLRSRSPAAGRTVSRIINAVAAVFMGMIAWTVWPEFVEAFESCHFFTAPEFGPEPTGDLFADLGAALSRCEYFGTPGIFTAPWWPVRLAMVFGVALCAVIFAIKAVTGEDEAMGLDRPTYDREVV